MVKGSGKQGEIYLGDGAYASFDGCQVWVYADIDGLRHSVALDGDALARLFEFCGHARRGELTPVEPPR